mgnify:CR=1 FL=1
MDVDPNRGIKNLPNFALSVEVPLLLRHSLAGAPKIVLTSANVFLHRPRSNSYDRWVYMSLQLVGCQKRLEPIEAPDEVFSRRQHLVLARGCLSHSQTGEKSSRTHVTQEINELLLQHSWRSVLLLQNL